MKRLRLAVAVGMLLGAGATIALPASPASAHGALTSPISRSAACGTVGGAKAKSAACKAAIAASQPGAAAAWDDIRVPDVNGQDRTKIPDGKLCSGGLAEFAGLNLARTDWPTTSVTPGAAFTFKYETTIPHEGTFKLYVTNQNWAATRPLSWSEIGTTPFLTVTDPKIVDGAYTLRGKVPTGRTGHQIIYTIWQTTSTPDTYYSCSDVLFPAAATTPSGGNAAPVPSAPAPKAAAYGGSAADGGTPTAAAGGQQESATPEAVDPSVAAAQFVEPQRSWPLIAGVAVALLIIGALGLVALRYKPRPRHRRS